MNSITPELDLLLACGTLPATQKADVTILQTLEDGIDWAKLAQSAIDHGLAGLAGHALARVSPETVPEDILDAFGAILDQARRANRALFDELARIIDALAKAGIDTIPFKGPVLAARAFGDLGLRSFRDLDFLIRDSDMHAALAALRSIGYERQEGLTEAQLDAIHWIQGQEIMFRQVVGTCIEPHTRLTSVKMALAIDYDGLWRRARRIEIFGRAMLTLAPEDELLILAIHGGKEMWWNIKWACDVATFIGSQPDLDWTASVERARAQGCLRMLFLAISLARDYFGAAVPDEIATAVGRDAVIGQMMKRIAASWQAGGALGPPSNNDLSMERLRLHDRLGQQASYLARTLFLPGPQHVPLISLPGGFRFAYVPVKIIHDFIALPLWRVWQLVLGQAEHFQNTFAKSDLALAIMPVSAETRVSIRRHIRGRAEAQSALATNPNNAAAWRNLGNALSGLKRYEQALASYDKAIALAPDNMNFWASRRAAARAVGKKTDSLELAFDSQDPNAWAIYAGRLLFSRRSSEAVEATDRALALDPNHAAATRMGIHTRLHSCDWQRRHEDKRKIAEGVQAGLPIITPLFHRAISDSEAENRVLTETWGKGLARSPEKLWRGERYRHDKIRIAYISTDFRDHVVADAIIGCFERHDKTRFEITAISLGPNDGSEMRRRIEASMDRFIDAQTTRDADVAHLLRKSEIDIAVDLNGISGDRRTGILARRPVPIQVNYLGYPGTMGVPFMDYIIADHMVIPDENRAHYCEQVVYLPQSYLPSDRDRRVGQTPTRAEAGLPETGFVFACLNQNYKISPEIFDVWMRLLHTVPGSVIWLQGANSAAMVNLRREAHAHSVAPERLVFAPRVPEAKDYLARLRLADLFLDTSPYNAHATAGDVLCMGVPLVTCLGNAFPGRVAASLLHAVELPELVARSLSDYEALARTLAENPEQLADIKAKLMRNRETASLFDIPAFTRNLEAAYTTMWERHQAGLPPANFAVGV